MANILRYRQCPAAVSLLSELLKLDWRKRINAIDALKHPYFSTRPLPAQPGDLPHFEDSHEFDRRKFRGQRAAMPPAPAGGSVGVGPNGEWTANSGGRMGMETKNSRIPGAARAGQPSTHGFRGNLRRALDGHAVETHHPLRPNHEIEGLNQSQPSWQREGGLPPKPPTFHQPLSGYQGERADVRFDQRRDKTLRGRSSGRPEENMDSYIPKYDSTNERIRGRDGDKRPNADWRENRLEYSRQMDRRDYDRGRSTRRRSRSPNPREGDRILDRMIYRR